MRLLERAGNRPRIVELVEHVQRGADVRLLGADERDGFALPGAAQAEIENRQQIGEVVRVPLSPPAAASGSVRGGVRSSANVRIVSMKNCPSSLSAGGSCRPARPRVDVDIDRGLGRREVEALAGDGQPGEGSLLVVQQQVEGPHSIVVRSVRWRSGESRDSARRIDASCRRSRLRRVRCRVRAAASSIASGSPSRLPRSAYSTHRHPQRGCDRHALPGRRRPDPASARAATRGTRIRRRW